MMINKKLTLFSSLVLSSSLVLAACGDDEQVSQPVTDTPETTETSPDSSPGGGTTGDTTDGEMYGFKELSIDADYQDQDDAYDISYEEERGQVEAEYENKYTGDNLSGNDAYSQMEEALGNLQLTAGMSSEEVITQVIEAFGMETGFSSIEVDVTYADGTEEEYKQSGSN